MKTIVLFFLFVALAGVTASHSKKHKAQDKDSDGSEESHDWPQPQSLFDYGVPPEYGGPPPPPPPSDGDQPPTSVDSLFRSSSGRSGRRHQN